MFRGIIVLNLKYFRHLGFLPWIFPYVFSPPGIAQLMAHLCLHIFRRCVQWHPSEKPTKTFSHLEQFLCMAFTLLTSRESLRDIETYLRAHQAKLYNLSIRGYISKRTLTDTYETNDYHISAGFVARLNQTTNTLYASDRYAVELNQTMYTMNAITIDFKFSTAFSFWSP
jgi:hypothetical protein